MLVVVGILAGATGAELGGILVAVLLVIVHGVPTRRPVTHLELHQTLLFTKKVLTLQLGWHKKVYFLCVFMFYFLTKVMKMMKILGIKTLIS